MRRVRIREFWQRGIYINDIRVDNRRVNLEQVEPGFIFRNWNSNGFGSCNLVTGTHDILRGPVGFRLDGIVSVDLRVYGLIARLIIFRNRQNQNVDGAFH